jgi:hypothetical protein
MVKKLNSGEIFLTAMAKSNDEKFLATGNNSGDVYIFNLGKSFVMNRQKRQNDKPKDSL